MEFFIRCNLQGIIEQVVSETEAPQLFDCKNVSFSSLMEPDSLEAGLQFIREIIAFGRAEDFELTMRLTNVVKKINCSGVTLSKQIFISGHEAQSVLVSPTQKTVALPSENPIAFEENLMAGYEEMFEELSRLNNELINAKRELIRKNKELERFQVLLKKDKTVS